MESESHFWKGEDLISGHDCPFFVVILPAHDWVKKITLKVDGVGRAGPG